jgi:hypothetical protein
MTALVDQGRKEDLFEKGRRRPFYFILRKVTLQHLRIGTANTKY